MPPFWCFSASPGTRLLVYTRPAGTNDEEQLRRTLPVGGWGMSHDMRYDSFAPLVPLGGLLVTFHLDDRGDEEHQSRRRRELAERFGFTGEEVVRAEVFLPENVPTTISGQVHVRDAQAPTSH